jgi:hypothetical protein
MEKTIASRAALESMVKSILKQREATKDRRPKIVRASVARGSLSAFWYLEERSPSYRSGPLPLSRRHF